LRSDLLVAVALLSACGGGTGAPTVERIAPAQVSNLVDTMVRVEGRNFYLDARADLGGSAVDVTGAITVALDDTVLADVTRLDATALDVRIPAGTLAGVYDLVVTTGGGAQVRAADALTVVDDPVGLPLTIEDAPAGAGHVVDARTVIAGDALALHAVVRRDGVFVAEVAATWTLDGALGLLDPAGPSSTTTLAAQHPGTARVHASHPTAGDAVTGPLTVVAGAAARLEIVDGTGASIGDVAMTTDDVLVVRAEQRDRFDNLVGPAPVAWAVTSALGTLGSAIGPVEALDPVRPGVGTVTASDPALGVASTGTITVAPGRAATLAITPATLIGSADDAPIAFAATGLDADGNPTADLGTLTWSVASGPIGRLDAAGVLDPQGAGLGAIAVVSSHGGSAISGPVTIVPGRAAALAVVPPTLICDAGDAPIAFAATATDADGNLTTDLGTLTWSIERGPIRALAADTGLFTPVRAGVGRVAVTSSHGPSAPSGDVTVQGAAHLSATLALPARAVVGQLVTARLTVRSDGVADTLAVAPGALTSAGGLVRIAGPSPATVDVAVGGAAVFEWTYQATASGPASLSGSASGLDAAWGTTVTADVAAASSAIDTPAALVATLAAPASAWIGATVAVVMTVANSGQAPAELVAPAALMLTGGGGAVRVSGPTPASATIAGGAQATFGWSYRTTTAGALTFSGTAAGVDGISGVAITTPLATATMTVLDLGMVATDPFADGTPFTYVFGYAGRVYLGPNRTGTGAVRFALDGSGGESVRFGFSRDSTGNSSSNSSSPPYPSLGATGCAASTAACGPDNEDGRGLFAAGTMGGTEWLIAGGARSSGNLDYVYASSSLGTTLAFSYVDLHDLLGGQTKGLSAMHGFGNRLYLGFPDTGGNRPYLVALVSAPRAAGLDAVAGIDAVDLDADGMGNLSAGSTSMIDSITDFGSRLYIANAGGCWRSTTTTPRPYGSNPNDWAPCTPSAIAHWSLVSRSTAKTADLTPADKAVPQFATFSGRLFAGRNTTSGPQLWACSPATTGDAAGCDPGDWTLVAANTSGNLALTQLGATSNASISMVVATASYLYVGFDNATTGLQLHRTALAAPTAAGFEQVGTAGLGSAARTRILSAQSIGGVVYAVVGDGVTAASVWRIGD